MTKKDKPLRLQIESEIVGDVTTHIETLFNDIQALGPMPELNLMDPEAARSRIAGLEDLQQRILKLQRVSEALKKVVSQP